MNTNDTHYKHKLIDASRLLLARFQEPTSNEYQRGWNDALETACDVESGLIFIKDGDDDGRVY